MIYLTVIGGVMCLAGIVWLCVFVFRFKDKTVTVSNNIPRSFGEADMENFEAEQRSLKKMYRKTLLNTVLPLALIGGGIVCLALAVAVFAGMI